MQKQIFANSTSASICAIFSLFAIKPQFTSVDKENLNYLTKAAQIMLLQSIRTSNEAELITPKDKSFLQTKDYAYISVSCQWMNEKFDDCVGLRAHNLWLECASENFIGKCNGEMAKQIPLDVRMDCNMCVDISIYDTCKTDAEK